MKNYIFIIIILASTIRGISQINPTDTTESEVFTIVESMPEFTGGQKRLFEYLAANINYPPRAKSKNIQGKVYVNFTVGKDGSVGDVKVIKGVYPLLDNEAVRVISAMPKWKPGMQKGEVVSVSYNLPISFILRTGEIISKANTDYHLATDYLNGGEIEKALETYNIAISKDFLHMASFYNRGICFFKLGKLDDACKDWNTAKSMGDNEAKKMVKKHCRK